MRIIIRGDLAGLDIEIVIEKPGLVSPGAAEQVMAIAVLFLGVALGERAAPQDCERFGAFAYAGKIYDCKVRG